jgi:hypothetical protein
MLSTFQSELSRFEQERANLDLKIDFLRAIVRGLEGLSGEEIKKLEPLNDFGLTDACREVLKSDFNFMGAMEVRDALVERGFVLDHYKNPLASIHITLRRLAESGELESKSEQGKTLYRWKPHRFPRSSFGEALRRRRIEAERKSSIR